MKLPSFQFYPGDWMKDPGLRSVSLEARGLWIDMLCLLFESGRRGYLQHATGKPVTNEQLARMTGSSPEQVSRLLQELEGQGVKLAYVTLHVGLDTFAPVTEDSPEEHKIHTEWCELSLETADLINQCREKGGRIIAVGTTSVRTLESAARYSYLGRFPKIAPYSGQTDLYILPGFRFALVDAMITNFHLPKSTLLMLVSAFTGREVILQAYEAAKQEGYRFYSFGDAMLIV